MRMHNKLVAVMLGLAFVGGAAAAAQARVTEKVEAMIAENTPLKVHDTDIWFQVGGPLVFGIQYDKFATANVVLGAGLGSYLEGTSLDLAIKYHFLTGKFTPFLSGAGVFYYSDPKRNIFALGLSAGLAYTFDGGLGLSLGASYVKAISESQEPFSSQWVNDSINWVSPQFGLHWNF